MSSYLTTENSALHQQAVLGVMRINLEALNTAEVISTFRNAFPSIKNYLQEVIIEFRAKDETEANLNKSISKAESELHSIKDFNFVNKGHTLVQTPEGFKDRYIPYLNWLDGQGVSFITESEKLLQNYYQSLSMFISSKEAKLSTKDNTRMFTEMEKSLANAKEGLASFFESSSTNALMPVDALFDRAADIPTAMKISKDLNRKRNTLRTKEILKLTNSISDLLNLLVESSENDKIPEVSGQAATSLAQGALVAAHYVEFVGVLRYRIEEALNAVSIAIDQMATVSKK